MRILLCAATAFEIQPTQEVLEAKNWGDRVSVCITGVGLMGATYSITRSILDREPDLILQAGIAGSFDENLSLGEAVAIETEALGDAGVIEENHFKSLFDLGLLSDNEFPWQKKQLENPHKELLVASGLTRVSGITVNEVSTNRERIAYLNNLGAKTESMEGAALHYAALKEGIRFLQIRSLSNYVGERDKRKWKLPHAIESLNENLESIISKLILQ